MKTIKSLAIFLAMIALGSCGGACTPEYERAVEPTANPCVGCPVCSSDLQEDGR